MEATTNVIKKTQVQVNHQFEYIEHHLNEVKRQMDTIDSHAKQKEIQHLFSSLSVKHC